MYVCMYVCMCVYVYIYIYIHIRCDNSSLSVMTSGSRLFTYNMRNLLGWLRLGWLKMT